MSEETPGQETEGQETKKAAKPAAGTTSADVVEKGKKTAREIQLEKQVSALEDEKAGLLDQVTELTKITSAAKAAPSGRSPGKSLLDEINEFMGFGG